MYNLTNGYHAEVSGNGYDLLIRESDDAVIAKNEGIDLYDNLEEMATAKFDSDKDQDALEIFGEFIGF